MGGKLATCHEALLRNWLAVLIEQVERLRASSTDSQEEPPISPLVACGFGLLFPALRRIRVVTMFDQIETCMHAPGGMIGNMSRISLTSRIVMTTIGVAVRIMTKAWKT